MCLLIQEGVERFGHRIHSFCFMRNHVHLAVQVNQMSVSQIAQHLSFRYTRYINRKYARIGHLFQGRFKSVLIDENRYLTELIRYIHLNPVRARLVQSAEQYMWSSHRAYLLLDYYVWLTCNHILKKFGETKNEAIKMYHHFILKKENFKKDCSVNRGLVEGILGDEKFVGECMEGIHRNGCQKRKIDLSQLVTLVCNRFDLLPEAVRAPGKNRVTAQARAVLALFVRESDNLSLEELAAFLSRDSSGLSKLAYRLEQKCYSSQILSEEIADLREVVWGQA